MGLRVGVGWGRLGVCGSADVPPLWRLGGFGTNVFGTLLSLELEGSREDILYDEIYIMIIIDKYLFILFCHVIFINLSTVTG